MAKINKKCNIEVPDPYHIKSSPLICSANHGLFLYVGIFVMKELRHKRHCYKKVYFYESQCYFLQCIVEINLVGRKKLMNLINNQKE